MGAIFQLMADHCEGYADHGSADAQFNRLTDKIVRDTVEAAVEFDVVVDAYLGLFPLGILVRCGG